MIDALLWTCLGAACAALAAEVAINRTRRRNALRRAVFANLDNALENGQFDDYLRGLSSEDLAEDLAVYAEDLSGEPVSATLPYVREWKRLRNVV